MSFLFTGIIALNPQDDSPIPNGAGQLYAVDDTTFATPIEVTDLSGTPKTTVRSGRYGKLEDFQHPTVGKLVWKSGSFPPVAVVAWDSLVEDAAASRLAAEAAQTAAENVETEIDSLSERVVPDGTTVGHVLTFLGPEAKDYGWAAPTGGSGGGSGFIVVESDSDPVPAGTPPGTLVISTGPSSPDPVEFTVMTGAGNVTTYGSAGAQGISDTVTCTVPSNTAVGDLLVFVAASQNNAFYSWSSPGAGWSQEIAPVDSAESARSWGIWFYPVTDAAALSALGSSVSSLLDGSAANRSAGMLFRVVQSDLAEPYVFSSGSNRSGLTPSVATTTTMTLDAFTSTFTAAGLIGMCWCHTSDGTFKSDASSVGWTPIGRAVGGLAGDTDAASELMLFWQASSGTSHGQASFTIDPPTVGAPTGVQFALKAAV